jgi:hypothetical protein
MAEHLGRLLGVGTPVINRNVARRFGCIAAYCPGAYPNVPVPNLVSPGSGDLTTQGGAAHVAMTPEGPGLALSGTATNIFLRGIAPKQLQQAGRLSIFVRCQWFGNGMANWPAPTFGLTYNTTGASSPYYSYLLSTSDSGHANVMGSGLVSVTPTGFNFGTFGAATLTANQMVSAGSTYPMIPGTATGWNYYQNGVLYTGSNSAVDGIAYGATPWVVFGDPSTRGRNVGTTPTVAYIFNRVLTPAEMRYLDANPYCLLQWPGDLLLALARLSSGAITVRANFGLPIEDPGGLLSDRLASIELLARQRDDYGVPTEGLSGAISVTGDAAIPIETTAAVLRDWGMGAKRPLFRRLSRPGFATRFRRMFLSHGTSGILALESAMAVSSDANTLAEILATQRADPGVLVEALGAVGTTAISDSILKIEALAKQRNDGGAEIENSAVLRIDSNLPAEASAEMVLDNNGGVEWLAGGMATVADATIPLEWEGAASAVVLSVESGPGRIRLLATPSRVRLLRRS